MADRVYPPSTGALSDAHKRLTPESHDTFQTFSQKGFANGVLTTRTKQLVSVAVAHVTQCPYCIRGHTKAAMRDDATGEELMEAIWVAHKCAWEQPMSTRGSGARRNEGAILFG